jgi:hypothetical protein
LKSRDQRVRFPFATHNSSDVTDENKNIFDGFRMGRWEKLDRKAKPFKVRLKSFMGAVR